MTRIVCLGDSFTEGMCDDLRPDGRYLGWADRAALGLAAGGSARFPPPIEYANLAVRGKLLHQVVAQQLPVALAMTPDLATFHAGPNDLLRPGVAFDRLLEQYEAAVGQLRAVGAAVVLFTSLTRTGGTGRVADRLAERFERFNLAVQEVAERHECLLVDDAAVTALADRRLWAIDRLHLNPEGHHRVAGNVLHHLGVTDANILGGPVGWWSEPLPADPPRARRDAVAADLHWAQAYLLPWIGRRIRGVSSGDGISPKDAVPRLIEASAPPGGAESA